MARWPKYQRDDVVAHRVKAMTGYGIVQADVAKWLMIDTKTLRKHYKQELDTGAIEANARVVQSLYKNAVENENVTAQIWWTKARMGWKGTDVLEQQGDKPFAIFVPAPIDSTHEWLKLHAPNAPQLEHAPVDQTED